MSEEEADVEKDYQALFEEWVEKSQPHYAAIGLVAAHWAYFEAVIDDWCLRLANIPAQPGACLTSQIMGSGRKLDAFISIVGLLGIKTPSAKSLAMFAQRTAGLAEQRNRAAAHDPWDLTDPDNPYRLEVTARKKLRIHWVRVSTDELNRLAGNIKTLTNDFEELAQEALTAPREPSSDKPPPEAHRS